MIKELKITMEDEKMTFEVTEGTTNIETIVMAVNLFKVIKQNMDKQLPEAEKVSLKDFINNVCTAMVKEDDVKNEQQN